MAKPDLLYGPFPWVVSIASSPSGGPAVSLADVIKWYWRVRQWTTVLSASFSMTVDLAESDWYGSTGSSTALVSCAMSVTESWNVLPDGLDELSLAQALSPTFPNGYFWIPNGSPIASGSVSVTDSLGYGYASAGVTWNDTTIYRTMFTPARANPPYIDGTGARHMTRDPISGLYTPFLGDYGPPLWLGGYWSGDLTLSFVPTGPPYGGIDGELSVRINSVPLIPFSEVYLGRGNAAVAVTGLLDGHSFASGGFVNWDVEGGSGESGSRTVTGVTAPTDGAISLTVTPSLYWEHAPRIDPTHPTYDSGTGAIVNNPDTGVPWTIQEIISRHGP